jgi:hypothetical protein
MKDPVRDDAHETVRRLRDAGFTRLVMVTGDRPNVAAEVARISTKGIQVPSGLANISRLRRTTSATRKKSTTTTKPVNTSAVCNAVVRPYRVK